MTAQHAIEQGALNLLFGCGRAVPGGRILIVHESAAEDHYDPTLHGLLKEVARRNGLSAEMIEVGFDPGVTHISPALRRAIARADLTVFLARLGDQLRFRSLPEGTQAVISYALSREALGSPFATAPYRAFARLKSCIDAATERTRHIRITCPAGTRVEGDIALQPSAVGDVGLRRFPMLIARPVPAASFSGRVALCGFLTGTGAMYYEPYSCLFSGPVFALLDKGRLAGFEGSDADVVRANAHYDHVANLYGIDRNFVHSWHAGIHPGCAHPTPARDHLVRWGGYAFGNPRLLHFHTCGAYAPGEISWNVLDPSVEFDGVAVWEDGQFHPDRVPGGERVLNAFPEISAIFATPDRRVGL